ncbi:MAG: aminotransferase class V-fold PLP-dependent enzyme, partial [Actinomycetota bacterium]|nr:aminotransferase class V-fold PLP-dependent enzyme [Actinomycetota bacterium]
MSIPANIKEQFPLLSRKVHGKPIVYLDSAASSQKPDAVLSAMDTYYRQVNANVHRGAYEIAAEATEQMETARSDIAKFINAYSSNEIIFTKNATEAFNLVARSWGARNLGPDDAILITDMEHHANIVPWQILAEGLGFEIRWIPLGDDGTLDLTNLDELLEGVKLCSVTAMSNVLGTLNPIRKISDAAHAAGALMLMDGSQYVPHLPTDVADLDVDFMCFTGHKMCGPTG